VTNLDALRAQWPRQCIRERAFTRYRFRRVARGACTTGTAGAAAPLPLLYRGARGQRNALYYKTSHYIKRVSLEDSLSTRKNIVVILYIGQHWTLSTVPTQSQAVWRPDAEACRYYVLVSAQEVAKSLSKSTISEAYSLDSLSDWFMNWIVHDYVSVCASVPVTQFSNSSVMLFFEGLEFRPPPSIPILCRPTPRGLSGDARPRAPPSLACLRCL